MNKIDFVIPYLDSTKKEWISLYNNYKGNKKTYFKDRFENNILFKYVLLSIEKYIPWINNLILIVQSEDQVPEWINRDNVKIILHKDFIPKEYLPTFNSCTIECFLHNIECLEEQFIYSNDDIFIINECKITDFFKDELYPNNVIYLLNKVVSKYKSWYIHYKNLINMSNIIKQKTKLDYNGYYNVPHAPRAFLKSFYKKSFEIFKYDIINSIHKFRDPNDISQILFCIYYSLTSGIINRRNYSKLIMDKNENLYLIKKILNNNKYKFLCLENSNINNDIKLIPTFKNKFILNSKYIKEL